MGYIQTQCLGYVENFWIQFLHSATMSPEQEWTLLFFLLVLTLFVFIYIFFYKIKKKTFNGWWFWIKWRFRERFVFCFVIEFKSLMFLNNTTKVRTIIVTFFSSWNLTLGGWNLWSVSSCFCFFFVSRF